MNHEEGVLFHATLPNTLAQTHTHRCKTSLLPSSNWWRVLYCQIDFPYSAIVMTQERRRRRKDAIINNFIFQSAYLSRANKKELHRKMEPGLKSSQIALLFFLSWNVTDYHETRKLNSFFHLSNNWFDISEHFKGSLARRLCSKLQYKAEDLPLAECQVYARLPLPIYLPPPFTSSFSPLLLSLSFLPKKPSEIPVKTLHNLPPLLCLCVFVLLCPGLPVYCNTIKARCVYQ